MMDKKPQIVPSVESGDTSVESSEPRLLIDLASIEVGERLTPLSPRQVDLLASNMAMIGQLAPIIVAPVDQFQSVGIETHWRLIAGNHRLHAAKLLGWSSIWASTVEAGLARLVEIDENLMRGQASTWDQGKILIERQRIVSDLAQAYAHGGDRRSEAFREENAALKSALAATGADFDTLGARMGLKKSTLYSRLWLARTITDDEALTCRTLSLLDNDALMRKLAACAAPKRAALLGWMREHGACSFKQAEEGTSTKILPSETPETRDFHKALVAVGLYLDRHGKPAIARLRKALAARHPEIM